MSWITPEQRTGLTKTQATLAEGEEVAKDVAMILATMLLTNAVLTGSNVKATKSYVTSKYKVQMTGLPAALKAHLATHDSEQQGKAKASKGAAVDTAPLPAALGDSEAEPPRKKHRRLARKSSQAA